MDLKNRGEVMKRQKDSNKKMFGQIARERYARDGHVVMRVTLTDQKHQFETQARQQRL